MILIEILHPILNKSQTEPNAQNVNTEHEKSRQFIQIWYSESKAPNRNLFRIFKILLYQVFRLLLA